MSRNDVHKDEPWTPEHGAWCRRLLVLGCLDPQHEVCCDRAPEKK